MLDGSQKQGKRLRMNAHDGLHPANHKDSPKKKGHPMANTSTEIIRQDGAWTKQKNTIQ